MSDPITFTKFVIISVLSAGILEGGQVPLMAVSLALATLQ